MIEYCKPTLKDVAEMMELVEPEIKKGIILHRSEDEIANTIRSYFVAKEQGKIVGFCALYLYSKDLAEVRSLIVSPSFQKRGIGKGLVEAILQEGRELGVKEVLSLTYQVQFFEKMGFAIIDKALIPNPKIWTDCIKCKRFPVCDEVALLKRL